MSKLQAALELARAGYFVFPLLPGKKTPAIPGFPSRASRDEKVISDWWTDPVMGGEQGYNIGISTTVFGEGQRLLVLDVDKKGGRDGGKSLEALLLEEGPLPVTARVRTPTGGEHFIFTAGTDCRQTAGELGVGLDTRGRGGYIVAAGSEVGGVAYEWLTDTRDPKPAPLWLVERLAHPTETEADAQTAVGEPTAPVDIKVAVARAVQMLETATVVPEGYRNHSGYAMAAKLKDLGVPQETCAELMSSHWKCEPPLGSAELVSLVRSVFLYGQLEAGVDAPERQFTPVPPAAENNDGEHPFDILNRNFAFVSTDEEGGVVWETTDAEGRDEVRHLTLSAFHKLFAPKTLTVGKKTQSLTEAWMKSDRRRAYDGFCFRPEQDTPPRFYNLWRGFSVKPAPGPHPAVDLFLEHLLKNVCQDDAPLFNWLVDFFAHLIQRPWDKPRVALVFSGGKGVGKSVILQIVGSLLGSHFAAVANRRYLTSNFNSHLESCLLLGLEEAFWSGDKSAEGSLKDLITGTTHVIEQKGRAPYVVANCTRVVILGNEAWLAPASHDERRFAVFGVGEARKNDFQFFGSMLSGMRSGGSGHLLHYLQSRQITSDINKAPHTEQLLEQKEESLPPVGAWWLECLIEGRLVGSGTPGAWQEEVLSSVFRDAYHRHARDLNYRSWFPDASRFGRQLKNHIPLWGGRVIRRLPTGGVVSVYKLGTLSECRAAWDAKLGGVRKWPEITQE